MFKSKNRKFKNKVGIITGSSRGIGKVLAKYLCMQGAKIVLNGRDQKRLEETASAFQRMGFQVLAVQADVTNAEECQFLVAQTLRKFGRIDFLVNNGSLACNESFEHTDPKVFREVLMSNTMGAAMPTRAALPFITMRRGSVLFISSLAGLSGMPQGSAYSAGKMALTALWQSLKIEQCNSGVHFGICYLGFTKNDAEKRMLGANGNLVPVPHRPAFLQKSQEKVAEMIAGIIRKRKAKVVFSTMGKMAGFMFRYFPNISRFIMIMAEKKRLRKLN